MPCKNSFKHTHKFTSYFAGIRTRLSVYLQCILWWNPNALFVFSVQYCFLSCIFFFVSLEKISLQLEPNIIIIFRVRTFVFQVPFTFRITCVLCAADSRCLWIGTHIRSISIRPCDYLNTLLEWVAKGKFNLHLVCRYVCQNLRKETRNGLIEKCENKFKSIALTKAIRPKTLW